MTSFRLRHAATLTAALLVSFQAQSADQTALSTATPYGFIQLNATYENTPANGAAAYSVLAKQPADNGLAGGFYGTARASRLGLKGSLLNNAGTYLLEADFGGSLPTNGKSSASTSFNLRHAYIQSGSWLVGQTWTNVYDLDAAPETIDSGAPINSTGLRQAQVRYQLVKNDADTIHLSVETPTASLGTNKDGVALINDRASRPDVTFRWSHKQAWGQVSLAGTSLQYVYDNANQANTANGYLLGLTGSVNVGNGKLIGGVTKGNGAGRYLWGSTYQGAFFDGTQLKTFMSDSQMVGYQHKWSDKVRSNLNYSVLTFADTPNAPSVDNKQLRQYLVNTFVAVAPGIELGVEWEGGKRMLFNQNVHYDNRVNMQVRASF